MSASIIVEEESGTSRRSPHPHNGYYAGDFSTPRVAPNTPAVPFVRRGAGGVTRS